MSTTDQSPESNPLKEMVEARGIKQEDLAVEMKTSRVAINQVLNGKRGLSPLMALKLEARLGVDSRKILEEQLVRDLDEAYRENKDVIEEIRSNAERNSAGE